MFLKYIAVSLINFYQIFFSLDHGVLAVFAPGGACRFEVSCSEYMKQSIIQEGTSRGIIKGIRRILSCR